MRKSLKERGGLNNRKAAKKPVLTDPNFVARHQFALQHSVWTFQQHWSRTICMDEKLFTTEKDSKCKVWRRVGTRYDAPYVLPKNHNGRVNIN
ncbi:hypothetical protein TSAR_009941 [Trichomalopsis sarcophagae]|uniref:Transposase Tc1-like domain-containing protein n=1 Tax=Trichomalopsis sarcophagae TaxID=543379 RepID=A0A232EGW6_9HYME|nr:hypothetical protein TSAR_009941 [Trichomalopsis sarcophagae]